MASLHSVDLTNDASFEEFHDVYVRSYDREFDNPWLASEKRVNLTDDAYSTHYSVLARDDAGEAIAGGYVSLSLKDNTDFAFIDVFTLPSRRRHGVGTQVLDAMIEFSRAQRRGTAIAAPKWGVGEESGPGRSFAERHGFELDLLDAVRILPLPTELAPLVVDASYTLQTWRGPCPDDIVDQYADLRRLLVAEAPSGDAGLENRYWDAERVRQDEADFVRAGRQMQVSVARSATGELAGHTQLCFPDEADEVFQWDTLVRPEHRGHGLGLALKIHAMQASADLLAGRRRITTYNAAANSHMIAVNERLGFRQTAWVGEYVRKV